MSAKIQFIAYEIDTHDTTKINSILAAKGAHPDEMTEMEYFILQANELRDRLQADVAPHLTDDTLTIFTAPEFYFKYEDGKPYSRVTFYNQVDYMKKISESFPQVLWVPGTVWWSEPAGNDKVTVHNTVAIYHAGRMIRTWQKTRVSNLDGLNAGPEVWDRWEIDHARILDETQDPFFTVSHGTQTLQFGVEVCLDHRTLTTPGKPPSPGVLRTMYLKQDVAETGPGVDVHLLVAAGMDIKGENVVARAGGVILRSDGGQNANRSSCAKVERPGTHPGQALRAWKPRLDLGTPQYIGTDRDNRIAVYPTVTLT